MGKERLNNTDSPNVWDYRSLMYNERYTGDVFRQTWDTLES